MDNFKAIAFKGIKWNFVGQIGGQVIALIVSIVLARVIAPEYFGKIAMVNVVVGFSSIFINLGFSAALIQKDDVSEELFSSIFWLTLVIGCFLSIALFTIADLLAIFYSEKALSTIAKFLSPLFFFNALGNTSRTFLVKAVDFKYLSLVNIVSISIGGLFAISIAINGYPLYALIAHLLGQAVILNLCIFFMCKWKPSLTFSYSEIKKIMNFSLNVLGNDALNYWVRNIDTLLIGKYLGSFNLGIYNKSYSLLTIPLSNISGSVGQVLFPSLSSIKDDVKRVREVYLKVISSISILVFPAMIGVFVTADKVVLTILGESWVEAIDLVRIFCFLGMVQSISSLVNNLYLSQGRADLMFKVGTLLRVMLISSIIVGLAWGIKGVAVAYTIAGFVSALINNHFGGKLVGLSLKDFTVALAPPFLIAISMGSFVYLIDLFFLLMKTSDAIRLILQILIGVIIYFALIEFIKPVGYVFLKKELFQRGK